MPLNILQGLFYAQFYITLEVSFFPDDTSQGDLGLEQVLDTISYIDIDWEKVYYLQFFTLI